MFLDVERLEAGKFDNNLLSSIRQAKYFLLVLTPNALDRCVSDEDRKDWVHRVIHNNIFHFFRVNVTTIPCTSLNRFKAECIC